MIYEMNNGKKALCEGEKAYHKLWDMEHSGNAEVILGVDELGLRVNIAKYQPGKTKREIMYEWVLLYYKKLNSILGSFDELVSENTISGYEMLENRVKSHLFSMDTLPVSYGNIALIDNGSADSILESASVLCLVEYHGECDEKQVSAFLNATIFRVDNITIRFLAVRDEESGKLVDILPFCEAVRAIHCKKYLRLSEVNTMRLADMVSKLWSEYCIKIDNCEYTHAIDCEHINRDLYGDRFARAMNICIMVLRSDMEMEECCAACAYLEILQKLQKTHAVEKVKVICTEDSTVIREDVMYQDAFTVSQFIQTQVLNEWENFGLPGTSIRIE